MTMSSLFIYKQAHPIQASNLELPSQPRLQRTQKDKVVVVMGATGSGKSRLSIDLATRFNGEVINSDKMQVYKGLDVITNKVMEEDCCGVQHHLLGIVHPNADFTCIDFCNMASMAVSSILAQDRVPIIAGGSNSYIEALSDNEIYGFRSKYECCYLWVDVSMPVLHQFISQRVDQMVKRGMVDEARQMFNQNADYSKGISRAIGVPEFDHYFRVEASLDEDTRARLLQEAIYEMKINTCKLASRQVDKILRLRNDKGWNIHRLDATGVFLTNGKKSKTAWKELVLEPSMAIMSQFLNYSSLKIHNNATMPRGETSMVTKTH